MTASGGFASHLLQTNIVGQRRRQEMLLPYVAVLILTGAVVHELTLAAPVQIEQLNLNRQEQLRMN